jgi:hypothetical protein
MRIDKVTDPLTRQLVAYRISYEKTPGERVIWLDGRPSPSPVRPCTRGMAFRAGSSAATRSRITTTHLKESYVRRNGVATSFRATVVEQISLEEPYLEVTFTVIDPDYLTEPLVRSATYMRAPTLQLPPYPCQPEDNQLGEKYRVPHYLPGENPYLTESAVKYKVPEEASRGGADTLYPEWRAEGRRVEAANGGSRRSSDLHGCVDAHRGARGCAAERAPTYDKVERCMSRQRVSHRGRGRNIVVSAGGDGIVMVDSGAQRRRQGARRVRQINQTLRPPEPPRPPHRLATSGSWKHAFSDPMIRLIINTSSNPDHVGGNANIRKSPLFRLLGYRDPTLSLQVLAHANVQSRMVEAKAPDMLVPTTRTCPSGTRSIASSQSGAAALSHAEGCHRRRHDGLVPALRCDRRRRHLQQRRLSAD